MTLRAVRSCALLLLVIPAKAGIRLLFLARRSRMLLTGLSTAEGLVIQFLALGSAVAASLHLSARIPRAGHFLVNSNKKVTKETPPPTPHLAQTAREVPCASRCNAPLGLTNADTWFAQRPNVLEKAITTRKTGVEWYISSRPASACRTATSKVLAGAAVQSVNGGIQNGEAAMQKTATNYAAIAGISFDETLILQSAHTALLAAAA